MDKRIRIILTGNVQGVSCRYFISRNAEKLGLKGFVKNLPDKTVEVVAEGPESLLLQLVDKCRHGPENAKVKDIDIEWDIGTGEFMDFLIHY